VEVFFFSMLFRCYRWKQIFASSGKTEAGNAGEQPARDNAVTEVIKQ
jgi:hypothetical protein